MLKERIVITLNAVNKAEALEALAMLTDMIKNGEYDGCVEERISVVDVESE